jgi:hypothetical protein
MGEPTRATVAFGADVSRRQVDEWLDKAASNLDDGKFAQVVEVVAGLSSKPLGNRLAVAYLKSVSARPERVGRESLQACKCDGASGWFLEDDGGAPYARACEVCNPERHDRQQSPAVSDAVLGVRNHLNHADRATVTDGSDRWGCEVCREKHGGRQSLSAASSWK